MRLQDLWDRADSESAQLSIRAVGLQMQRDLNIETLDQLDDLAKEIPLHPASALMDHAWHIYVLGAAWAKYKYPEAGRDGWRAFGSVISELTAGRIWGDIDSGRWQQAAEGAKDVADGDHCADCISVFRQLETAFFST